MSIQKKFLPEKEVFRVKFILPVSTANGAKKVVVLGDFNNWDPEKYLITEFHSVNNL